MKDNLSRIMLCFAALDLSDAELRQLVNELHSMSWRVISMQVSALREFPKYQQVDENILGSSTKHPFIRLHDATVGDRVEQLLKVEAGLTTTQAVEKLSSRFEELSIIKRHMLPSSSRKSLRVWVNKVARLVPEKVILKCATIIRNEYVHRPITDWLLKGS